MRVLMGVVRNRHGVYLARKFVREELRDAVAEFLSNGKDRQSWLQRSLGTKDAREANVRAKPVLMEFDRILARAALLTGAEPHPLRDELSAAEIKRIADYHYASLLAEDAEVRRDGSGKDRLRLEVLSQLLSQGVTKGLTIGFDPHAIRLRPHGGLTVNELAEHGEAIEVSRAVLKAANAQGDVDAVEDELDELSAVFGFRLSPGSDAYRSLGAAVLAKRLEAANGMASRQAGDVVPTPVVVEPDDKQPPLADRETLRGAFEGWRKAASPTPSTEAEFERAVGCFVELHGDLPVCAISRRHVRLFREALQQVPVRRAGPLRTLPLPALVEWAKEHPDAKCIAKGTVNKLLEGVGAVVAWAGQNGFVPEDAPWANPFAKMLLPADEPNREPWRPEDLPTLFADPVFTAGHRPTGGAGEAAFWLPLLGLFTGARLGELATLTAADLRTDASTGIRYILVDEDAELGSRVKTKSSRRAVPLHFELERLGFLELCAERSKADGVNAMLFPKITRNANGQWGAAWSKWFGRYIRKLGIKEPTVFHSFRHGVKDNLRRARVGEDVNDALTGHAGGGVGRTYGAKDTLTRFGAQALADAVAELRYPSLVLSEVRWRP